MYVNDNLSSLQNTAQLSEIKLRNFGSTYTLLLKTVIVADIMLFHDDDRYVEVCSMIYCFNYIVLFSVSDPSRFGYSHQYTDWSVPRSWRR